MNGAVPKSETFSRREFLKLGALALASFALSPLRRRLEAVVKEVRLDELGLGDYQEVYIEGQKIKDIFGVSPPIFTEVYQILDDAASNSPDKNDEKRYNYLEIAGV